MKHSPTSARRLLPEGLRVLGMNARGNPLVLTVEPEGGSARCPLCQSRSARLHSRYTRALSDLPWRGLPVKLEIRARKFFCPNRRCERKIFCERLPEIRACARKTDRLEEALVAIAFELGGEAGARLARALGFLVSPDALLDRLRPTSRLDGDRVRVLGVDDFAFKKGRSYGTILVDLERRRVVDLLPDRTAETLSRWLKEHPSVEVVSRDRSSVYAEGVSKGAPEAVQVADRWHLLKNLRETLERVLQSNRKYLKLSAEDAGADTDGESPIAAGREEEVLRSYSWRNERERRAREESRAARKEKYERAVELRERGATGKGICREVGVSVRTLRRWFASDGFPERKPRSDKAELSDRHAEQVARLWREGCHNVQRLYREISADGYRGSERTLYAFAAYLRNGLPPPGYATAPTKPGSDPSTTVERVPPRSGAWALMLPTEKLRSKEQRWLERLLEDWVYAPAIRRLALEFADMVREGKAEELEDWIGDAECCGVAELKGFADGLMQDYDAVGAALELAWSNGQVEGQIHRLKMLKRQMYGRAGVDLLKRRVMKAA